jgi:hypothetical protein
VARSAKSSLAKPEDDSTKYSSTRDDIASPHPRLRCQQFRVRTNQYVAKTDSMYPHGVQWLSKMSLVAHPTRHHAAPP